MSRFPDRFAHMLAPITSCINHYHLLKEFVLRDVKGRFAGSMAGIFWAFLNPVATILVYFFIFSIIFRIQVNPNETGTSDFVVFFLTGYFPWLLFSESLTHSAGVLIENTNLITKVVFPVELLPTSAVLAAVSINGFGLVTYLAYLAAKGYASCWWLWFGPLFTLQMFFTFGCSFILAALCVFIRDVKEMLGIFIMVWFNATPIIYPLSLVPKAAHPFMLWNPMAMFVLLYRDIFLLQQVHWAWVVRIAVISLVTFFLGAWFFMRARPAFGDVL